MFAQMVKKAARGGEEASPDGTMLLNDPFLGTIKQDLGAFESAVAAPPAPPRRRFLGKIVAAAILLSLLGGFGWAVTNLPVGEYLFAAADRVARVADGDMTASGPIPPSSMAKPSGLMQPPAEIAPGAGDSGSETSLARRPWLAEAGAAAEPVPAPAGSPAAAAAPQMAASPLQPGPVPAANAPAPAASAPVVPAAAKVAPEPPKPAAAPSGPVTFAKLPPWGGERKALRTEPLRSLHQRTDRGTLPIVANGQEVRKVYSRPFENAANKPKVAVLVTGLGLAKEATDAAIAALPPEATLAFSPYSPGLAGLVTRSWQSGHEVLMILPGQTERFPHADPGPMGILSGVALDENAERLERVMGRAPGAFGVTSYGTQGNPVFQNARHLAPLFQNMRERGMAFVGPGARNGVFAAEAFAIADEKLSRESIEARLAQAVEAARRDGQALVVIGARPASFERVLAWAAGLEQAGVVLAPVSALLKATSRS